MTVRSAYNEFQWLASHGSVAVGVTVTPGNNTYVGAAYAQLISGAQLTEDAYGIEIHVDSVAVSAVARDCTFKLAIDPSGGTSFAGNDIGTDILCSCAGGMSVIGVSYFFPIKFRAGSSIGIAMSVNNATVGTGNAYCRLPWKPSHPDLIPRTGSMIRTYGATPASSSGTAITPNAAGGKSAFVQLGTIATDDFPWWWCLGIGCNNAVMNNNAAEWDLAIGSSTTVNRKVLTDVAAPSAAETMSHVCHGAYAQGRPGDLVFAAAGGQGASPTGMSVAAYGVI